ncbi:unnamed protein product [Cuscuta europaea]|uniref:Uncharacterized protein n=1 Tax=Cuscuta europaea TaxID=41803 RepID=A0A9P0VQI7_CUSEU|nr:unnamed protein product [Cuscuta europaea]
MSQMLPSADRLVLARMDDGSLEAKILLSSASNFMGLCEHLRRVEQMKEAKGVAEGEAASLRKRLAEAEDSLRLTTDSMEQRVQAARADGKNEGLAEAGEAAAEAARVAAEEARVAKEEAVSKAREDAVAGFTAEGWKERSIRSGCPRWWRLRWMLGLEAPAKCGLLRRVTPTIKVGSFSPSASYTESSPGTSNSRRRSSIPRLMASPLGNQTLGSPSPKAKRGRCLKIRRP